MFVRLKKRSKIFVASFIIIVTVLNAILYMTPVRIPENVSCYYSDKDDALSSADTVRFGENCLYFVETSCKGGLDGRQACAIESAARFHPDWKVNVLFTAPGTEAMILNSSAILDTYKNVKFYRIHLTEYAKDTPLENFLDGALKASLWPFPTASDFLRILTLYKWGGMYLDLDVIVVKPLVSLARNFVTRESNITMSNGALAITKDEIGRGFAKAVIEDMKANFDGSGWGLSGPVVITRVIKSICSTSVLENMNAASCKGFEVYGPEYFYPIPWRQSRKYFKKGLINNTGKAFVLHMWNHITHNFEVEEGSLYEILAAKSCPTVFRAHFDEFRLAQRLRYPKSFDRMSKLVAPTSGL